MCVQHVRGFSVCVWGKTLGENGGRQWGKGKKENVVLRGSPKNCETLEVKGRRARENLGDISSKKVWLGDFAKNSFSRWTCNDTSYRSSTKGSTTWMVVVDDK